MMKENNGLREFSGFVLDAEKRVLWFENKPVSLALKEIELLCALTEKSGEVIGKNELIEKVWMDSFVEESNLTRHIYVLRKTLRDLGAGEDLIQTVPRRGYRFAADVRPIEKNALVIEKFTDTETTIEFEEISVAPDAAADRAPRRAPFASPRLRLAVSAVSMLLVAIAGLVIYGYRYSARTATTHGIRSIAVLPFRTISPAHENAHEGLGMADVLITRLSNLKALSVRPTSAISGFENEDSVIAGQKLKTDAVLEGTIYRTADKVRVTARLVRVADNSAVWAGQFEKPLDDELAMQNEIALQLTEALALNLSGGEKHALGKTYTESADAYRLYTKARYEWSKRNYQGGREAEKLFRQAIERDPNFALAYSGLADAFSMTNESAEALFAAQKALAIDPNLAEAHASVGLYRMFQDWRGAQGPDWRGAEASFRRAVELNPNYTPARQWYATLLAIEGRPELAQAELRRALEINPLSYNLWSDLSEAYYFGRRYREAEECALKALEINPEFVFALGHLRQIYRQTGDYEKYIDYEQKFSAALSVFTVDNGDARKRFDDHWQERREIFRKEGVKAFVRKQIVPSASGDASAFYGHARAYAFLGEREKALEALERAFEQRAFMLIFVKAEPAFDELRDEPRFREILRQMDLL